MLEEQSREIDPNIIMFFSQNNRRTMSSSSSNGSDQMTLTQINQLMFSTIHAITQQKESNKDVHRVCKVISKLKYKSLVKDGILPDLHPLFTVNSKRYHKWVYDSKNPKKGNFHNIFSCMGLFYDGLVRKMLSQLTNVNWGPASPQTDVPFNLRSSTASWEDIVIPFLKHLLHIYGRSDLANTTTDFNKRFGLFNNLYKQLTIWFQNHIRENKTVQFNTEFAVKRDGITITGHPDLVTDLCVIDIKTSSGFKSMADQTFLQILAYVALMRANKKDVPYVGVLLPLQCQQIILDISKWDHKPYLDTLFKAAGARAIMLQGIKPELPRVGHTTRKIGDWSTTIRLYVESCGEILPVQILLTGRLVGQSKLLDKQLIDIRTTAESLGVPLYNHGPYTINLSKPWTKNNPEDKTWGIRSCISILKTSSAIGARGVIIHTGKHTDVLSRSDGYDNLINNLRTVIAEAHPECPLMLETPVGCGTEIGHTIDEFSKIYSSFTVEEKKRFKVCIDTCHVFAAGHDPYDYLVKWDKLQGYQSIGLVHFNDSKRELGCRVDRHNYYTQPGGQIGYETLKKVAIWCNERAIPMVTE